MKFSAWLWGRCEVFPPNIDGMAFFITANIAALGGSFGYAAGIDCREYLRRRLRIPVPAITIIPALIGSGTFAILMPFVVLKESQTAGSIVETQDWPRSWKSQANYWACPLMSGAGENWGLTYRLPDNPSLCRITGVLMAGRVIMRIELSSSAKREFETTPEAFGMTQLSVTNALFRWFLDQNEEIQASVLGFYPEAIPRDVTTMVLKRIISEARRPDCPGR
jgi:hypothetical protein